MSFWAFSLTVIDLTTDLVPFLAALGFASLVRNRLDLMLAVANLCLLMELVATIANPDYGFIDLMAPRPDRLHFSDDRRLLRRGALAAAAKASQEHRRALTIKITDDL